MPVVADLYCLSQLSALICEKIAVLPQWKSDRLRDQMRTASWSLRLVLIMFVRHCCDCWSSGQAFQGNTTPCESQGWRMSLPCMHSAKMQVQVMQWCSATCSGSMDRLPTIIFYYLNNNILLLFISFHLVWSPKASSQLLVLQHRGVSTWTMPALARALVVSLVLAQTAAPACSETKPCAAAPHLSTLCPPLSAVLPFCGLNVPF